MSHQRRLWFFRTGSFLLRNLFPIIKIRGQYIVSHHADVERVLAQDEDFTIKPINGPRIEPLVGAFALGLDRSPQVERETGILRKAVRKEDHQRLLNLVQSATQEYIDELRPSGRIDVVQDLALRVPARIVSDFFGVPGPDEKTLKRWTKTMFYDSFLNLSDNQERHEEALVSAGQLRDYLNQKIGKIRTAIDEGNQVPDTYLARLVHLQKDPETRLDADGIRRNISGIILGVIDTLGKFTTNAMDQLLRQKQLPGAIQAAQASDRDLLLQYAFEAARFDPAVPAMFRYCPNDLQFTRGNGKIKRFKGGNKVVPLTYSAMMDAKVFHRPRQFRTDREYGHYIHFGYGLHRCFGEFVIRLEVPEIIRALVLLPNVRRAKGQSGFIQYDPTGAFPEHLVLEFDPK